MDHVGASQILPEVADAMTPFLREKYANPSSICGLGEEITEAMEEARDKVANLNQCVRGRSHFHLRGNRIE